MKENEFDFLKGNKGSNGEITPFFIRKIELTNEVTGNEKFLQCLNLYLTQDLSNHNSQISIEFYNINNKDILNLGLPQLTGLQIDNIANRQMENCNFHVFDYEDGKYDFYCEKINIK